MSLNNVTLMGRLTADPELKTTPSGVSVTSFNIAVDRKYTPQGEERKAYFIPIVAWRNTADFICKYFNKGSMIGIEGEVQTRQYTDKNGNNRTAFEVVVSNVSFCGSKSASGSSTQSQPASFSNVENNNFSDLEVQDDDLPF